MTEDNQRWVKGQCPMGCGQTLFLGDGGYVTCSYVGCPDPSGAGDLLQHSRLIRTGFRAIGEIVSGIDRVKENA